MAATETRTNDLICIVLFQGLFYAKYQIVAENMRFGGVIIYL